MFIAVPPSCLSYCLIGLADMSEQIVVYHRAKDYVLSVHSDQDKKVNKIVRDVIKRHRAGNLKFALLKPMIDKNELKFASSAQNPALDQLSLF